MFSVDLKTKKTEKRRFCNVCMNKVLSLPSSATLLRSSRSSNSMSSDYGFAASSSSYSSTSVTTTTPPPNDRPHYRVPRSEFLRVGRIGTASKLATSVSPPLGRSRYHGTHDKSSIGSDYRANLFSSTATTSTSSSATTMQSLSDADHASWNTSFASMTQRSGTFSQSSDRDTLQTEKLSQDDIDALVASLDEDGSEEKGKNASEFSTYYEDVTRESTIGRKGSMEASYFERELERQQQWQQQLPPPPSYSQIGADFLTESTFSIGGDNSSQRGMVYTNLAARSNVDSGTSELDGIDERQSANPSEFDVSFIANARPTTAATLSDNFTRAYEELGLEPGCDRRNGKDKELFLSDLYTAPAQSSVRRVRVPTRG